MPTTTRSDARRAEPWFTVDDRPGPPTGGNRLDTPPRRQRPPAGPGSAPGRADSRRSTAPSHRQLERPSPPQLVREERAVAAGAHQQDDAPTVTIRRITLPRRRPERAGGPAIRPSTPETLDATTPPQAVPTDERPPVVGTADSPTVAGADRPTPDEQPRPRRPARNSRAARIDDTLSRITAAHAGVTLARRDDEPAAPVEDVPTRGRRLLLLKVAAGALSLAVLGAATLGWVTQGWLGSGIAEVKALDPASNLIVDADAQRDDENLLIVAGRSSPDGAADDTITLAHRPSGGGQLTVLSFPASLRIDRPQCERWDPSSKAYSDQIAPAEAATQLGAAYQVGGPRCVTQVVQQLSGIAITGFVGLDVDGLGSLANVLGGVAVCAPRPVDDAVLGPLVPAAGFTRLDAHRATDYARAAAVQSDPPTGRGRVERQQLVLAGALQQAIGGTALLDVSRTVALRPALGQALISDGVDLDEMLALGQSLQNLEAGGVAFATVPSTGDGNPVLRDVDASALFAAVRTDKPLPTGATNATTAPVKPTVGVLNATARTGLGAQVAGTLTTFGFVPGDVGTAEQVTDQTLIRFSPDQAAAASLLATTVPSATSVPDPGTTGVLQLVIGSSFDDVLLPPAAAPAAQAAPEQPRTACA